MATTGQTATEASAHPRRATLGTLYKILSLLSTRERRQLYGLFAIIVLMALIQAAGIASITPFLALVANPEVIETNALLNWLYTTLDFDSQAAFLVFVGVLVLIIFTFSSLFAMFSTWLLIRFSFKRNYTLSKRLLEKYLRMPYVFFLNRNTADLSKNVLTEVREVIAGVLVPGMHLSSKAVASVAIIALLVIVDPVLALATTLLLGSSYGGVYTFVRHKLQRVGEQKVAANLGQYQAAGEALAGIKDIKLLGKEHLFLRKFSKAANDWADSKATGSVINKLPHYVIESLAFGGMLLIVIYLLAAKGDLSQVVPVVGLYAFASYRLLPAIKEIFSHATTMKYYLPTLDNIYEELQRQSSQGITNRDEVEALPFHDELLLQDVTFRYPGAAEPVVSDFSISIRANTSIAFVGPTGSGKTTTVDIILGLLEPDSGRLLVDGLPITNENLPRWQKNLGYVPQHIYLTDDTILGNIAFGVKYEAIDKAAAERAARMANIHNFIVSELSDGYDTFVGERGVRLSGGQRQRIGIARALYHDPEVLILDEATSALDGVTEQNVFNELVNSYGSKTVILIAHRFSTIRNCEVIYVLDHGRIVAQGTYDHLIASSPNFRALASVRDEEATVAEKVT